MRKAPVWPSREGVATMRGRNTMRFSAPTREPPGGRPSRGAKLKGRGCTRQRDARNENRLGGTGAAKKAPSEQGATKAAGLGAADARLEPRQWSAAERVSRDRRRKRRCCARPLMKAKAHGACGAQHFVFINARYSLAHTKAGARSGDAGNTDFPLGFIRRALVLVRFVYEVICSNALSLRLLIVSNYRVIKFFSKNRSSDLEL